MTESGWIVERDQEDQWVEVVVVVVVVGVPQEATAVVTGVSLGHLQGQEVMAVDKVADTRVHPAAHVLPITVGVRKYVDEACILVAHAC